VWNFRFPLQWRRLEEASQVLRVDSFNGHPDQGFGHITYSQYGEDLIVANIFQLLGVERPSYLDVGAHHPINISNTAYFYLRGSRGINVEANPNCIPAFRQLRPEDVTVNVGVGSSTGIAEFYYIDDWSGRNTFSREAAEEFVRAHPQFKISKIEKIPIVTLNDIVDEYAHGRWPDFLTLDIEGSDVDALRVANFGEAGPAVICAEAVSGNARDSAGSLLELLRGRGYRAFCRTVSNVIFVRDDKPTAERLFGET